MLIRATTPCRKAIRAGLPSLHSTPTLRILHYQAMSPTCSPYIRPHSFAFNAFPPSASVSAPDPPWGNGAHCACRGAPYAILPVPAIFGVPFRRQMRHVQHKGPAVIVLKCVVITAHAEAASRRCTISACGHLRRWSFRGFPKSNRRTRSRAIQDESDSRSASNLSISLSNPSSSKTCNSAQVRATSRLRNVTPSERHVKHRVRIDVFHSYSPLHHSSFLISGLS